MKLNDRTTRALLIRAAKGDQPIEAEITMHLALFAGALIEGRKYDAALHHQQCERLLEAYAKQQSPHRRFPPQ